MRRSVDSPNVQCDGADIERSTYQSRPWPSTAAPGTTLMRESDDVRSGGYTMRPRAIASRLPPSCGDACAVRGRAQLFPAAWRRGPRSDRKGTAPNNGRRRAAAMLTPLRLNAGQRRLHLFWGEGD